MREKTLKTLVEFEGIGIHTGEKVHVKVYPRSQDGIIFRRSDLKDELLIQGHYSEVINTKMSTTIGTSAKNSVATIEHFMGALFMLGIDHAFVEIDGPEMPLGDGSATLFVDAIEKGGLLELETPLKKLIIQKQIIFENETARVEFLPSDSFKITQSVCFREPVIGEQKKEIVCEGCDLMTEIAPARTFGNIADHEKLKSMGLARGATLDNVLVYDDNAILSPSGKRFEDEIVRHKMLDTLGDLFTSGYRIQGHYITHKGGHFHNNEILKKIFSDSSHFKII